ncbi:ABC transporter substrate-binding protein [Ancylobacter sp. WKF20]|uniref:ABC transporter substrate-binding protein n=1 Tax=Ancylobacter sp. WKF20 TaxID=3039801 RepID=UPI00243442B3|nr:ABC transporter substrate-binding protein [Ancylobacter sp. WKF20]WGD30532.1 ABC transporter substrate-binding protein [Ancylobacter sp. WKF20]
MYFKNFLLRAAAIAGLSLVPLAATAQTAPTGELAVGVPKGVKLVIADDANYVAKLLELSGEQEKLAADVSYANFTSGPLRLEAIRAGAAQVGAVGDVPPILAQYSGANVVIVGAVVTSGAGTLLATSPGSGIKTLADLKGKKIGINVGTAQQATVLRNLKAAGLAITDIQPINLGLAEFADALRAGQIDAAVLKQPDRTRYLNSVKGQGDARALDNAPGANTNIKYLYASVSALQDPAQAAAIRDFVVHWYRAHLWKNAHRDIWVNEYLVKNQRLKDEDAALVWESEGDATSIPGLAKLVPIQQETTDLLQAGGSFKGKTLDAKEQFDLRYQALNERSPAAND